MEVKLLVTNGTNAGQRITLPGPKFFIGRAEDCQLRPRSQLVSRHHCVILVEESYVAVRDFGSKEGTYVNGEPVKAEQELKTGDRLKVGPLEFEVELAVSLGGRRKPQVRSLQEAAARTAELTPKSDLDVAHLLGEDEQPGIVCDDTDTAGLAGADIVGSRPGSGPFSEKPAAGLHEAKPEEASNKQEEDEDIVGIVRRMQEAPNSDSSRDAAADMLRNFFNRRQSQ